MARSEKGPQFSPAQKLSLVAAPLCHTRGGNRPTSRAPNFENKVVGTRFNGSEVLS